jgi:hypothetical protein
MDLPHDRREETLPSGRQILCIEGGSPPGFPSLLSRRRRATPNDGCAAWIFFLWFIFCSGFSFENSSSSFFFLCSLIHGGRG